MAQPVRKRWLTHRYGKSTFLGRWGIYIVLGVSFLLFPLFAAGKFPLDRLHPLHRAYIIYLGPFIFGAVVIACLLWALFSIIGRPRITLVEGLILVFQVGAFTGLVMRLDYFDSHVFSTLALSYAALIAAQFLYLGLGASIIHWAARRDSYRSIRDKEQRVFETAWLPSLFLPPVLAPIFICGLVYAPIIPFLVSLIVLPIGLFAEAFRSSKCARRKPSTKPKDIGR